MRNAYLVDELLAGLVEIPLLDAHTHLVGGKLGARGLHDIVLYHMVISDLYAAGCPNGARLTTYPGRPTVSEAQARLREALPYLPAIQNTSCWWGVRLILRDLYGWNEPISDENWMRLDAIIRERADDRAWQRDIARQAGIRRFVTEWLRREQGQDDDLLQYALEWGFFTRCQWGEYDTALYELERCWGRQPEVPLSINLNGKRAVPDHTIRTLDDVHAALAHYVQAHPTDRLLALATHISTDLDLRLVTEAEMTAALERRAAAGPVERDIYASYINEAFLTALESHPDRIVFQFSLGAEPLPFETSSRLTQHTLAQLAEIVSRHPRVQFVCTVSSRHANQTLCTLCRELPNFTLAGYWWHNFFPGAMRQVMEERLDMLPATRQIGFFSDAYCLEWAYAKAAMVRTMLAQVLAQKVEQGQYTTEEALAIARTTLYESAQQVLKMRPAAQSQRVTAGVAVR